MSTFYPVAFNYKQDVRTEEVIGAKRKQLIIG
jgi:hypothetical protein